MKVDILTEEEYERKISKGSHLMDIKNALQALRDTPDCPLQFTLEGEEFPKSMASAIHSEAKKLGFRVNTRTIVENDARDGMSKAILVTYRGPINTESHSTGEGE